MLTRRGLGLGLLAAGSAAPAWAAPLRLRLPREPKGDEGRREYPTRLLRQALQALGQPFDLTLSRAPMNQARSLIELADPAGDIDLAWTMTSREMERQFEPVRVPLFMGLYGYRVLLVRRGDSHRFEAVRSLADLAAFRLGQGAAWPDTRVLRAGGLTVVERMMFNELVADLARGHSDAFPRSVAEVATDARANADRFEIEPRLLLHYPTAMYFFVRREQAWLARRLEVGLALLHANGSFHAEFRRSVEPKLAPLQLGQRLLLRLDNPELPAETPLARKAWWYRPEA